VLVTWGFEPDDTGTLRLVLRWEERGGPKVEPPSIKGFGHVVIERVVGQALSAKVEYQFAPQGVQWSISMPLEFVVRWRSALADAPATEAS
jgi:two-component sensor histidine kinase